MLLYCTAQHGQCGLGAGVARAFCCSPGYGGTKVESEVSLCSTLGTGDEKAIAAAELPPP